MARKNRSPSSKDSNEPSEAALSTPVEELLLAALERGEETLETGRYVVTFKENAAEEGIKELGTQGLRVADARDFEDQEITIEALGDAESVVLPEAGVAVMTGVAVEKHGFGAQMEIASDSPIESVDPEYFMFAEADPTEGLRGLASRAGSPTTIAEFLRRFAGAVAVIEGEATEAEAREEEAEEEEALVLGATWGLTRCKVPPSIRSGVGIRVAVLDTGFDLRHPDFIGRPIVSRSFVGQPVMDLNGHGTHVTGTACGPKAPPGSTPRYGIGHRASIFSGKVLTNSGGGTMLSVLSGMNWAIANRAPVISMSLGASVGPQPAYTAAGASALSKGLLIIAAAGNSGGPTGAPANSPTIMAVASLDPNLAPSAFSSRGKIEIAAPGRDVFSSWPRPRRYHTISGTSMATPHVSGCAALWAETSPALRAQALWRQLQRTARRLPYPVTRVGAGLVQAP